MKSKLIFFLILFLAFVLRFYQLGNIPLSLYWDEASLGYNAFSISQTLRDEHGEFLPVTRFMAFGDYKPPGYIYADALAVRIFGLSDWAVRFPSAMAGVLLVMVTFFLCKKLKFSTLHCFISSFLAAISPWAIQFSRAAFEANLATLFNTTGILLFIYAVNRRSIVGYLFSSVAFSLAIYTFNSHRIFVPLMTGALALIFFKDLIGQFRKSVFFILCLFILTLPLIPYFLTRESRLRFEEVSWTKDLAPIEESNKRIDIDGNTWWSKIIHNRRVVYSLEFLRHYTDNFRTDFLFYSGDANPRLSSQGTGQMFWVELIFLLIGTYTLLKRKDTTSAVIFSWLLLAPIPAAMARETPHALRILNVLPVPQIIAGLGIVEICNLLKTHKFLKHFKLIVLGGFVFSVLFYLRDYYLVYPQKYASSWQYGYKEMVEYVSLVEGNYSCISVTEDLGRPYIYFLLYNKYPPSKYWQTRVVERDWYGFWYVHSFNKYRFGDQEYNEKCLYIRSPNTAVKSGKLLNTISDPNNIPVFIIYEK